MRAAPSRLVFVDVLKAVASQLIIFHHLAFYGPLSDVAQSLAPGLMHWFSDYARVAVQAFLVVGGFLAARGLAPQGELLSPHPLSLIAKRYLRLVLPFGAALVVAVVGAALARSCMDHDSIPGAPTAGQCLAHVLLLQNILDVDALSAGVWYVAIDFQLFALLVLVLWATRRVWGRGTQGAALGRMAVLGLALASLFYFNRDGEWDNWALYFAGAYGLGSLAYWATNPGRRPFWLGLMCAATLLALGVDFRVRIAVALMVALSLAWARRSGYLERWPQWAWVAFLARISYSVFLVHFPVCLVVNGVLVDYVVGSPWLAAMGMGAAWLTSLAAGALFYHYVESRAWDLCLGWFQTLRQGWRATLQ